MRTLALIVGLLTITSGALADTCGEANKKLVVDPKTRAAFMKQCVQGVVQACAAQAVAYNLDDVAKAEFMDACIRSNVGH